MDGKWLSIGYTPFTWEKSMVGRVVAICTLIALWPSFASAQSAALTKAFNQYQTLNEQGRYSEAETFAHRALELGKKEFGAEHPHTGVFLNNLALLYHVQGR